MLIFVFQVVNIGYTMIYCLYWRSKRLTAQYNVMHTSHINIATSWLRLAQYSRQISSVVSII